MNILNSQFTQWALKYGLSKSGILVVAIVAFLLKKFGIDKIVPPENLPELKGALEAGGLAIFAVFYAWLQSRQSKGVKAMQTAINASENDNVKVAVDGIAGNSTVAAQAKIADVPVSVAIAGAGKS
jgi:hypothetical protein